jgi:hypothetical protein
VPGAGPRFFDDDPISKEPETQDASGVQPRDIDLGFDVLLNLFGQPGDREYRGRALNVTTIDEVADSSWFTNRIMARPVSIEEAVRGPNVGDGPAPGALTVIAAKRAGVAPGFTVRDQRGEVWFVSFDANGHPEAATAAVAVASKLFWAIGYYQVESHLFRLRLDQLRVGEGATFTPPSGRVRPMRMSDVEGVLRRAHKSADGSFRAAAGRAVPGKPLGGFRYYGTRPDDPNDTVLHEHRRELRALKVFGAWTNLVDMKAGNTLDTLVSENGRSVVRHYLQDVGSTFGTGALGPHDWSEGFENIFEGDPTWKRAVTLGLHLSPWQTVPYERSDALGRFEGDQFEPEKWKPRVPVAALEIARADDTFWAARRVAAFSDDLIRAIVKTGQYSDPAAEKLLADVLIKRRNRIAETYLTSINPLVDFTLDAAGRLMFDNAAVRAGVASAPASYRAAWFRFDNNTGEKQPIGDSTAAQAPLSLSALGKTAPEYLAIDIHAVDPAYEPWKVPVQVHFKRSGGAWKLVGVERLP